MSHYIFMDIPSNILPSCEKNNSFQRLFDILHERDSIRTYSTLEEAVNSREKLQNHTRVYAEIHDNNVITEAFISGLHISKEFTDSKNKKNISISKNQNIELVTIPNNSNYQEIIKKFQAINNNSTLAPEDKKTQALEYWNQHAGKLDKSSYEFLQKYIKENSGEKQDFYFLRTHTGAKKWSSTFFHKIGVSTWVTDVMIEPANTFTTIVEGPRPVLNLNSTPRLTGPS